MLGNNVAHCRGTTSSGGTPCPYLTSSALPGTHPQPCRDPSCSKASLSIDRVRDVLNVHVTTLLLHAGFRPTRWTDMGALWRPDQNLCTCCLVGVRAVARSLQFEWRRPQEEKDKQKREQKERTAKYSCALHGMRSSSGPSFF